jgi:hypothetical protein
MQSIEVLGVGIRVLGIFILVTLLREMPLIIETISQYKNLDPNANGSMTIYAALSLIFIVCSLVMIKFPISVAKLLISKSELSSPELNVDLNSLQITAITILGIFILSWAIPDLINNIIGLSNLKTYTPSDEAGVAYIWNSLITTIVEIAIGLYCALNSKGITKLINKLRY